MSELVPLPLMGEGLVRLLSIILAIAQAQGGTILIGRGRAESRLSTLPFGTGLATFTAG
ncbi:MAG: hypothetical protein GDA38_27435, partial [Hormoscilla sp. SP12CHS1]|nr:hypothetical protein [Hormoscilla sp. SP12CHS1]